jgi:hypothetical protein
MSRFRDGATSGATVTGLQTSSLDARPARILGLLELLE